MRCGKVAYYNNILEHGDIVSNKGQLKAPLNAAPRACAVSIYLVNGIKTAGTDRIPIDQYVVLLRNTVTQMVQLGTLSPALFRPGCEFSPRRMDNAGRRRQRFLSLRSTTAPAAVRGCWPRGGLSWP